jgi:CDP-diacylglycerol--glycerol-3-phosphate 3-phosphatidyltransferase
MASTARYKIGWANRVTIGRLLLIGPFVVCLLNLNDPQNQWSRWAAIIIFVVMALSDLVDGYLARRLHDESPLGAFLDPVADKLLVTFAVIILCVVGVVDHDGSEPRLLRLPNWVVVAAIGKDILVSIGFAVIYFSTGTIHIEPRRLGKWCTTVAMALVIAMLLWPSLPSAADRLPEVLWIATTALAVLSTVDYIRAGNNYIMSTAGTRRGSPK